MIASARRQGKRAAWRGEPRRSCPFKCAATEGYRRSWLSGYDDAVAKHEAGKKKRKALHDPRS